MCAPVSPHRPLQGGRADLSPLFPRPLLHPVRRIATVAIGRLPPVSGSDRVQHGIGEPLPSLARARWIGTARLFGPGIEVVHGRPRCPGGCRRQRRPRRRHRRRQILALGHCQQRGTRLRTIVVLGPGPGLFGSIARHLALHIPERRVWTIFGDRHPVPQTGAFVAARTRGMTFAQPRRRFSFKRMTDSLEKFYSCPCFAPSQ